MLYEKIDLPVAGGTVEMRTYVADPIPDVTDNVPRPAVVICGGGAYMRVSRRETEPVALRYCGQGINAYTVRYRTAEEDRYPSHVQDVAAAVAWVRSHAEEHLTDPDRIAILGFSAGGHAAANLGIAWQDASLWAPLGLTPEAVRPNAMVLCYPVINGGRYAHRLSFEALTGTTDLKEHARHSLDEQVTAAAPRTFLWATWEDPAVPVENTLLMAMALRRCGVSCEMHIYEKGGHGLALCDETTGGMIPDRQQPDAADWFRLSVAFLKRI